MKYADLFDSEVEHPVLPEFVYENIKATFWTDSWWKATTAERWIAYAKATTLWEFLEECDYEDKMNEGVDGFLTPATFHNYRMFNPTISNKDIVTHQWKTLVENLTRKWNK